MLPVEVMPVEVMPVARKPEVFVNRIECEFAALRYFALNGTDHRSHHEQDDAIGAYVRWRNQHAAPIRDFAVGSKFRRPDYLTNVA